jgi:CubicO group peptidase (beta-lactamase class C family)
MPSSRLIAFLVAAGTILPVAAPAFAESPARDTAACDGAAPSSLGDGWTVASPAGAGLDDQRLCALGAWLAASPQANVHAVLVIRHGALVFERYFSGEDQRFGRSLGRIAFTAETKHDLRSVTKSVVALLVGIALERGQIKSVDDAVLDYLPRYADLRSPEKDRIRLRHLLTMSAGLAWDEDRPYSDPANSENEMDEAADPYRYVLAQPMAMPPGERWVYNSGATALLAAVLQEVSGQTLDALARAELFEPLCISDVEWVTYPGNGDPIGEGGLRLRPRDLAKLGQLALAGGAWNGRQIVPAAWIKEALAAQIAGPGLFFYGYQWWLGRSLVARKELDWAAGVGFGGQRLFVVPQADLVVVVTTGLYHSAQQSAIPLDILNRYILAAIQHP